MKSFLVLLYQIIDGQRQRYCDRIEGVDGLSKEKSEMGYKYTRMCVGLFGVFLREKCKRLEWRRVEYMLQTEQTRRLKKGYTSWAKVA